MVKERSVVVFLRTRCRWMDSSRGDGNGGYGGGLLKGSHREELIETSPMVLGFVYGKEGNIWSQNLTDSIHSF
ncbi:hypothetical protein NC653_028199 [Populus alba x Populus x berolinensis]|uniref:Uncharacterized protein n=1 Tax=Populus alba x Populus x berolinensis TaxID=444605 RepID=A0AAD6Q603_9ROSI|nr:hypothetical protein NC653_028199 [Populus alba x Populus x berolinensis]